MPAPPNTTGNPRKPRRSPSLTKGKESAPDAFAQKFFTSAADRKRLKRIALDHDMTLHELAHAAFNRLLGDLGEPELEPVRTHNRRVGRDANE